MTGKIVIAIDSFKGSLTSLEAGRAAAAGVAQVLPDADCGVVPVADGGEGTADSLVSALGGKVIKVRVEGPMGEAVDARYGFCGDMAVIEIAAASGLTLVAPEDRNPWLASSYGTGELIRDAVGRGCRKFMIGLGGSATNDAGVGMLSALGFRFLDKEGKDVGRGGGEVGRIVRIDASDAMPELKDCQFQVACDVKNSLLGPEGASRIFGPQKGADHRMVEKLDEALGSFAGVVGEWRGKDFSCVPGVGAAGGMGFAFLAFLDAKLGSGVEMVLGAVGFDSLVMEADLVITGEGRLDSQTVMGKTPQGVLRHAAEFGVPVVAIGGSVDPDAISILIKAGFKAVLPIVQGPISLEEAMRPEMAAANISRTVAQIIRLMKD